MKLRVVVADDMASMLRHLVSLLETEFEVVATAENGNLALECIRRYAPDVVVLDLQMPVLNGIEVTQEARKLAPSPAIVICSVEDDLDIIEAAKKAGALGYVLKVHADRDLVTAVKAAACGKVEEQTKTVQRGMGEKMWMVKGVLLGMAIFIVGGTLYTGIRLRIVMHQLAQTLKTPGTTLVGLKLGGLLHDPVIWGTLVVSIAVGIWIVRVRASRGASH